MTQITQLATDKVAQGFNPLTKKLNDRMPGTSFRLPSMGLLYTNGEIDPEVKNGEILVKPMTTLDDIYMKTPDMIFQGTAIESVISRCIPQVLKPLELFAQDIDYLLICLKKVSSGNYITVKHECSECKAKENYDISLDYFIQNSKTFDPDTLKNLKLELSNGFSVDIRPAKMGDLLHMMQLQDEDMVKPEDLEEVFAKNLSANIKAVDGIEDRENIHEWIKALPREVTKEFIDKIELANSWGTNFSYELTCNKCEAKQHLQTSINPLFFFIQR